MAMDWQKIITGLFTKAKAEGVTPAERKALEDKAFDLMGKYQLEHIMAEEITNLHAVHYPVSFSGGNFRTQQVSLFHVIAKHFGCTLVNMHGGKYMIFGYDSDIQKTEFLYGIIEPQMYAELANLAAPGGVSSKSYRTQFLKGYVYRISERLEASKVKVQKDMTKGTAIAIRDRNIDVRREITDTVGRTTTGYSYYRDGDARNAGKEAGSRARFSVNDTVGFSRKELG